MRQFAKGIEFQALIHVQGLFVIAERVGVQCRRRQQPGDR
jgi:hypothetical protein